LKSLKFKSIKDTKLKNVNESSKLKDIKENSRPIENNENILLNNNKEEKLKDIIEDTKQENSTEQNEVVEKKEETKEEKKEEKKVVVSGEDLANARIEKKKALYKLLYEKEYEYADVLVRMLQSFRKPLIDDANSENPSITLSQIDTLFDGYDDMLNLSWSLCGELKYIYNMYKQLKPINVGK